MRHRSSSLSSGKKPSPYGGRCPVARTLSIIGERWTIMILRDLVRDGPRKFQDFENRLRGSVRIHFRPA